MPRVDTYEHGFPCWVDLAATDQDAAKVFYNGLFGWQWSGGDMPDGGTYWGATIDGVGVAGLMSQPVQMAAQGLPSMWNTYVAVDDTDATTAKAASAGATIVLEPTDVPGAGRMAFIVDPGGAAVGMWQAAGRSGAELVKEHGSLVWSEIYSIDTDATAAFYQAIFGWEPASMPMPDGGTYTMFTRSDQPVAGTMPPPREGVPPHWHVWFASRNAEETAARAAELGASVLVEPTDSPRGTVSSFLDPVGAAFSVITLAAQS